jgi:cell division protein FtsB
MSSVAISFELCDRRGNVNIRDSSQLTRRVWPMRSKRPAEKGCENSRCFLQKLPSPNVLICWATVLSFLLLMVSGCGYKDELEGAKQQIEKLNFELKRLTDETSRLKQETNRLSEESKILSEKNARIQRDLDDLNKAKAALSSENKELQRRNKASEEEIASLRGEKAGLIQEIEKLKKPVAEITPPPGSPAAVPTEVGSQSAKQQKELSPCDAVLAFMKASEAVVRQQKGEERAKSLRNVREQYAPKMKGAPDRAIKAAEDWVKEGVKLWDESHGEGVFRLLQLRNTVLDACGKSLTESGLK